MAVEGRRRPAWAEVDLDAVAHNAATLRALVAPARLCAVVKADGYGHGATAVAAALIGAGADMLAVAIVDEGIELRQAGVEVPILLLAEAPSGALDDAIAASLTVTVGSMRAARDVVAAAARVRAALSVHVKVDTGMHRLGIAPDDVGDVLDVLAAGHIGVSGIWTHLPVADGERAEDAAFTAAQLDAFDAVRAAHTARLGAACLAHAANTAGAITLPRARYDLVRVGLGIYGYVPIEPMAAALAAAGAPALRPVLSVKARVTAVRDLPRGARPSYGRRRALPADARVATVPVGYADGVPRAMLDGGAEVLIRGRRHPLAGVVTMDQLVVDCSAEPSVDVGDEVVLLGRQGDEVITADDWARALGTITWEVLCGFKARIPRVAVS